MTISDISLALLKEPSSLFGQREVLVEFVALSPSPSQHTASSGVMF
jgi:hypothetical protein